MQFDNMGSSTQHHIAIPINELSASLEAAREKNTVTRSNTNVQEPGEQGGKAEEKGECRYCQDKEFVYKLEAPCGCNGSLKYAHRSCIAHWCNIKGNIMCEICKQPYYPNYSATESCNIDMDEGWTIGETNSQILIQLQMAERGINCLLTSMNTDFSLRNPTGGVIFGTTILIFMTVLVIIDTYNYVPPKEDNFSHILCFAVVIITFPIYILSWIVQCQALIRERENERERDLTT